MVGIYTYTNVVPCVETIYKERNRLKNEKNVIQNNIKNTIDNTEEQIRKLKNKIKVLEKKKKTLIIEYNKDCDKDERLRGSTPPEVKHSISPISNPLYPSPKSRIINKEINDIKTQLNNDRFMKMIENVMNDKLNKIRNKIDSTENERKLENEKNQNSAICNIM